MSLFDLLIIAILFALGHGVLGAVFNAKLNAIHASTVAFLASHGITLKTLEDDVKALVKKAEGALTGDEANTALGVLATARTDLAAAIQRAEVALGIKAAAQVTPTPASTEKTSA